MHISYLLLGSNLGDREAWLQYGREACEEVLGRVVVASHIYETEPWGNANQEAFLNQAIGVATELEPLSLLEHIAKIESEADRQRKAKWGPRTLDIDILFYDDLVVETDKLKLPHPQFHLRNFALIPMAEVAPYLIHPVLCISIGELVGQSPDQCEVSILPG